MYFIRVEESLKEPRKHQLRSQRNKAILKGVLLAFYKNR